MCNFIPRVEVMKVARLAAGIVGLISAARGIGSASLAIISLPARRHETAR
jgi:hypothetical protein